MPTTASRGRVFKDAPNIVGVESTAQRKLIGQGDDMTPARIDDHHRFGMSACCRADLLCYIALIELESLLADRGIDIARNTSGVPWSCTPRTLLDQ